MAGVIDSLMVALSLDPSQFKQGMAEVGNNLKKMDGAVKQAGSGIQQMGNKWGSTLAGIARSLAAPLLAGASLGAMVKSFGGDIAQVAKQRMVYNEALEVERKRRAMLQRVTKEDLILYKQSREAMAKFDIATSNLSATFMRTFSPAMKWVVGMLDKFSDWVDNNQNNITRFLLVLAATVSTVLVPAFAKWAATMLANPITWLVVAIGALALIIDDLVTYIQGGESAFADFWAQFGTGDEIMAKLQAAWEDFVSVFNELKGLFPGIIAGFAAFKAFNFIVNMLKAARLAVLGFNAAILANPIGIIVGIIAFAITQILMNWETVRDDVMAIWEGMSAGAKVIWQGISDFISGIPDSIEKAFQDMADFISGIANSVQNAWKEVISWFEEKFAWILSVAEKVTGIAKGIGNAVAGGWEKLKGGVSNLFGGSSPAVPNGAAMTQAAIPPSASSSTTNSSEINANTTINGGITINTPATDPQGIADGIGPAIRDSLPAMARNAQEGVVYGTA